ncbi:MAG: phage major capsid protein [Hungatella sp.]|nr:phage major capsid protein [Hungatella sp.]
MSRYKMSSKAARSRKSMKMGADDLTEMVKAAVKEALDEQKSDEGGEDDPESKEDDLEAILTDAIESANAKRKSAKADEIGTDDAEELVNAILDEADATEDSKSDGDDSATDLADVIQAAVDAVNEKRKSAKADEIGTDVVDDLMEAVSEIMGDDTADEEAKGRKSRTAGRQTKSARQPRAAQKAPQRKYSSIYMSSKGGNMSKQKKEIPPQIRLARAIKCLDVWGRHDPENAAYQARKRYGDTDMEREFKALSITSPADGGYLIPEVYSNDVIELLYPKTVIVELGAQTVPLTNGNLNLPKMTAGSRAQWGGEQRKINPSAPKFGNIKLSAKRLEAIVPQTRELLMSTSFSADNMFANDLMRRMQLGLDYGGLYGTGGEFQPLGVAYNKDVQNINAKTIGNLDLADNTGKITADFPVFVRSTALGKNIDDIKAGWTFNSMLEGYLMNLKTTTGTYIYRDEMATGKLLGFPYKVSNQISTNLGSGLTDLFFGNWADLLIGDQMGLETYTTLDGTWTDDEGAQHNAFEENLAATRALMYDDIGVRHAESFLYCKNIKVL